MRSNLLAQGREVLKQRALQGQRRAPARVLAWLKSDDLCCAAGQGFSMASSSSCG
jgi:hypothetical protein